jgi:hypothetical protein
VCVCLYVCECVCNYAEPRFFTGWEAKLHAKETQLYWHFTILTLRYVPIRNLYIFERRILVGEVGFFL